MIGNPLAEPEDRLAWEVRAVAERLRRLSPARLRTPLPPYPSRAQAGRILAQRLADAAAGIVARNSDQPPQWREVPEIEVFAVGEQVAVTGNDLVFELLGLSATDGAKAGARAGRVADGAADSGEAGGEGAGRIPAGATEAGEEAGQVPDGAAGSGEVGGEATGLLPADILIWTRSGRRPLSTVIDELIATLRELRLSL